MIQEIIHRKATLSDVSAIVNLLIEDELGQTREQSGEVLNQRYVDAFEKIIAKYSGSKYGISCDSCTNALFMCLKYLNAKGGITIPNKTYLSVPGLIIHAGCQMNFADIEWSGIYQLTP